MEILLIPLVLVICYVGIFSWMMSQERKKNRDIDGYRVSEYSASNEEMAERQFAADDELSIDGGMDGTDCDISTAVTKLSLGGNHCGYVTEDGDLYMWGGNIDGQLGNGTPEAKNTPVKIMSEICLS